VGSVVPTLNAIIPAAVGVDIGCGMIAQQTTLNASDLPDNLVEFRSKIEAAVPHGRTNDGQNGDRGAWGNVPTIVSKMGYDLLHGYDGLTKDHPKAVHKKVSNHLGTLGTGNHFIELCLDENDSVWVMLHSGSRGPGNKIGSYFINEAKACMKKWHISLEDPDLAYLVAGEPQFNEYMKFLAWAQKYASVNREIMMARTVEALHDVSPKAFRLVKGAVNCHHNYVAHERHFGENVLLTRKGAISASEGELGIIPGSMGTRSYIVSGKGNRDSFTSCSHGAGRIMSRTKARKTFTVEDHIKATEGVECRKDEEVVDETPGAYKDIDAVMEAQSDLVDIVHTLKAVVCVKG
jgi:tRNA-splicing ligase RtcB